MVCVGIVVGVGWWAYLGHEFYSKVTRAMIDADNSLVVRVVEEEQRRRREFWLTTKK